MKLVPLALAVAGALGAAVLPAVAAEPQAASIQCIYPHNIRSSTPISDTEIVFTMNDGRMWKNTLRASCPGLKFEAGFEWEIHGDSVCANLQTIRVLRRGTACMLGEFSAYKPPPKPAQD